MVKELRREKSVSQLEKFAFLIRGKIRFFADISIDLTRERLKCSQNVAKTKTYLLHIFSVPTDFWLRTCALIKSVEFFSERLIRDLTATL